MWKKAVLFVLLFASSGLADRITLKNGEFFDGDFFGATSQEIRFIVNSKMMLFNTAEVVLLRFGDVPVEDTEPVKETAAPAAKTVPVSPEPPAPVAESTAQPAPPPVRTRRDESGDVSIRRGSETGPVESVTVDQPVTIAAGTRVLVRLLDEVDSSRHQVGATFRTKLTEPLRVNGKVALPAGTAFLARLVGDRLGDQERGETAVVLDLVAVMVNEEQLPVKSSEETRVARGNTKDKVMGGLAKAGARLGTILGGRTTGTVGDTAEETVDVATDSNRVLLPVGSMLSFSLINPISIGGAAPANETTTEPPGASPLLSQHRFDR